MSDNPRPVLYGSGYEAFLRCRRRRRRERAGRLVGKHCESGDVLIFDALLPADLAVGDILATPVTGAYGAAMAATTTCSPVRRWSSSATAGPGWSCAARRWKTWFDATWTDRQPPSAGPQGAAPTSEARMSPPTSAHRVLAVASMAIPTRARWCGRWVPYEEDPKQGKDRPVVIIGRRGANLLGVPLDVEVARQRITGHHRSGPVGRSRSHQLRQGRNGLLDVDPQQVRREGAVLERMHFDQVVAGVRRAHHRP